MPIPFRGLGSLLWGSLDGTLACRVQIVPQRSDDIFRRAVGVLGYPIYLDFVLRSLPQHGDLAERGIHVDYDRISHCSAEPLNEWLA